MSSITRAFLAALQSLVRSTTRMRGLLVSWYIRFLHAKGRVAAGGGGGGGRESDRSSGSGNAEPNRLAVAQQANGDHLDGKARDALFAEEVERLLGQLSDPAVLEAFSLGLQKQFRLALRSDPKCMLPSYNHLLPNGKERGTFLALDVGGSTFRVALVEAVGPEGEPGELKILSLHTYRINKAIKELTGMEFFDWMATKIEETIVGEEFVIDEVHGLAVGLAWSFPIEQTSLRSGLIQGMGKGFLASDTLLGKDLGDVIEKACEGRNLKVSVKAIVNDSTGTLLSQAYTDPLTRYGLILGTGVNIAVHLPVTFLERPKFGVRPATWHAAATDVIVNTELGMFGKGVLPLTRWDVQLNAAHERPDFQPLEHLVGGRYLGEVARLVLLDGIGNRGVLGGHVPPSLEEPYSLDTELLAKIQSSKTHAEAAQLFITAHPLSPSPTTSTNSSSASTPTIPTESDTALLRLLASQISSRSAAIIAASLHALWHLRNEGADGQALLSKSSSSSSSTTTTDVEAQPTVIACNGSVVERYPGFLERCQGFLDGLIERDGAADVSEEDGEGVNGELEGNGKVGKRKGRKGCLELRIAKESSILGAAVAVAAGGEWS